jgi:Uma2 family endonuclease
MSLKRKQKYTEEEYLEIDRNTPYKNEFINGEIFAMVGASVSHNLISGNVFASLHNQLNEKDCLVFQNDMRVLPVRDGDYYYPDIVVVCGDAKFKEDEDLDTLLNPILIVEVLSKSTQNFDRGDKFENYRKNDSLNEYILISQDKVHIVQIIKQPDKKWLLSEVNNINEIIRFQSINCEIQIKDIYNKVKFENPK